MSVSTTTSASTNASRYSGDMIAIRLKRFGWNTATTRRHPSPLSARRVEHRADLAGQVGVVVDQRCAVVDAADVEPSGDAAELGECCRAVVEGDADLEHAIAMRTRGVAHVVQAAQRQGRLSPSVVPSRWTTGSAYEPWSA